MSETRFGLLSGAAWALAAAVLLARLGQVWPSPATVLQFTLLGAAIGYAVTMALRRVRLSGALRLAAVSLSSLLAAGAAFCMTLSVVAFARSILAGHARPELLIGVLIAPVYWVWGLVATGLVVALWPLSALNHWWLGRLRTNATHAS